MISGISSVAGGRGSYTAPLGVAHHNPQLLRQLPRRSALPASSCPQWHARCGHARSIAPVGFIQRGRVQLRAVETLSETPSTADDASPKQSTAYPFPEIEKKWQEYWEANKTFRTPDEVDTSKPKYYVLDMFPYPR